MTESAIPDAGDGVLSDVAIPKGVRLGPYRGEKVKLKYDTRVHEGGFAWLVSTSWRISDEESPHLVQ